MLWYIHICKPKDSNIIFIPQSDEHEGEDDFDGDEVFSRIRSLLEALLADAQHALEHKSKATGRVLNYYDNGNC